MLFRFFGQRRPLRRYPTIHRFLSTNPNEQTNERIRRHVNLDPPAYQELRKNWLYRQHVLRAQIAAEVDEAMLMPEEPHEQLTEYQTRPTKIIPLDYDPNKTQPLLDTPEKGQ